MTGMNYRNQTGWRRLIGWLAAYLLVLHIFFAGVATDHFFAPDTAYGITLCLNHADGGSPSPVDGPSDDPYGKIHCVFCPAAMHANGTIEVPITLPVSFADGSKSAWLFDQHSRPAELGYICKSARAPPLEV
jgi:hypothetical protein